MSAVSTLGLAVLSLAAVVEADLEWNAPQGCASADSVRSKVEVLTGQELEFDVRGLVETTDAGYRLTLEVDRGAQTPARIVEASDCMLLSRAAALILALEADPVATATRFSEPPSPPPVQRPAAPPPGPAPLPSATQEPTAPARVEPAPVSRSPPPSGPSRDHVEGSLSAGVAFFSTPRTTGGLEGMAGWARGKLRLRVLVAHWFGTRASLEPGAGVRAAISSGGLRACFAPRLSRVWAPLCAGLDAGALHGRGVGEQVRGRRFAEPWAALAIGLGVEARLRQRVSLPIRLEATVPVLRSRVHLRRDGVPIDVFAAPVAGLRLVAGVGLRSR